MSETKRLSREQIDQLADDIAVAAARIDAATHCLLTDIRRFDEAMGWAAQGAKSCAHWLTWRIGIGMVTARQKVQVARALGSLPRIDAALSKGQLSYSKVRAMTRVATAANEGLLLAYASTSTGAQLERIITRYRSAIREPGDEQGREVRRRHLPDGTVQIEIRLEPDEADRVWQALCQTRWALNASAESNDKDDSAEARVATAQQATLADAAVRMAEEQLERSAQRERSSRPAAERRQLFVHLREERLAHDSWSVELHDGTHLCGETFKRLACDAGIVVAKTDDEGHVLDVGRRSRTVPPALMRALWIRDRHCRFPGCCNEVFVEAHHVRHWAEGGETSLDNTCLLCTHHHRCLHEGGCSIARDADGHLVFLDQRGHIIDHVPSPPDLGDQPLVPNLDIVPHTNLPDWDGTARDLSGAPNALLCRAG